MACFDRKQGEELENWAAHPYEEFRGVLHRPRPPRGASKKFAYTAWS